MTKPKPKPATIDTASQLARAALKAAAGAAAALAGAAWPKLRGHLAALEPADRSFQVGCGLIVLGLLWAWPPAGLIGAGAAAIAWGLLLARAGDNH